MKLLCSIFFILYTYTSVYAQKNIISATFQPTDLGYGIRYDRLFKDFGLYSGLTRGEYRVDEFYIKDHYKVAFGVTTPIDDSYLSIGLSCHKYGAIYGDFCKALSPVSFEVGAGVFLGRFNVAFRMDFLKGEGCVDFGIKL